MCEDLEITTPLRATEIVVGLSALAWLQRERDRINRDPRRHARIKPGVNTKGYTTYQLIDDPLPEIARGSHSTRIAAQVKAFQEHGRETPFTRRVF